MASPQELKIEIEERLRFPVSLAQLDIIDKYFLPYDDRDLCDRCYYNIKDNSKCHYCGPDNSNEAIYDKNDCDAFHLGSDCDLCFFTKHLNEKRTWKHILLEILRCALNFENYENAFFELSDILGVDYSEDPNYSNYNKNAIEWATKILLLDSIKSNDYEKADFLFDLVDDLYVDDLQSNILG